MTVRQLLLTPSTFFGGDQEEWLGPGLAVLALCTLSLASLLVPLAVVVGTGMDLGVAESFPTVQYVAGEARLVLTGRSLGVVVIVFLAPLPLLAAYGTLFHLLSAPFADRGSVLDTLWVTAWGAVPLAIADALTLAGVLLTIPTSEDQIGYAFVTLTGRTIAQRSDPSLVLLAANVLGLVCVGWAALLWTRGVAGVRGVSDRRAALLVGIPVALVAATNVTTILYAFR